MTGLCTNLAVPLLGISLPLGIAPPSLAGQTAPNNLDKAAAAIRAWYDGMKDGSDQPDLADFGTVGEGARPFVAAYEQLSSSLRRTMTETQFLARFRGVARLRLMQAHAVSGREKEGPIRVFVEEERTLVLQRIPAVAWYSGFTGVISTAEGYKISSLEDVQPEDIISPLGGHQPWRTDPEEAARVESGLCRSGQNCRILGISPGRVAADTQNATTLTEPVHVRIQAGSRNYKVDLARLHSGRWVVLDVALESTEPAHTPRANEEIIIDSADDPATGGRRLILRTVQLSLDDPSTLEMVAIGAAASIPPTGVVDFREEFELYIQWRPADQARDRKLALSIGAKTVSLVKSGGYIAGSLLRETETAWTVLPINLLKQMSLSDDVKIQIDGENIVLSRSAREALTSFLHALDERAK